jgi:hypothetical protein
VELHIKKYLAFYSFGSVVSIKHRETRDLETPTWRNLQPSMNGPRVDPAAIPVATATKVRGNPSLQRNLTD